MIYEIQTDTFYNSPVGFINFKLDKKWNGPEDYLEETLKTWKQLKNKYLQAY